MFSDNSGSSLKLLFDNKIGILPEKLVAAIFEISDKYPKVGYSI